MTEKKKKPHTEMQSAFLDALMSEAKGDIRKAMKIAGYAKNTKFKDVLGPLQADIIDLASKTLAFNAPKAVFGMLDVLDDPTAMGARNQIAAAAQVLDRTGLVKKEQVEVKNTGQAMFILPPKQGEDEV